MRILIAEDSVLLRAGLTRLLLDAGEDVIASVGDADELLTAVERHQPDLAVVDVRMPPTNTDDGLRAALEIRERWPHDRHPRAVASTSRSATPPSCSPAVGTTGRAASATSSRTGSPTSPSSSPPCAGWGRAAPPSTPRSSPSCSPAAASATRWPRCRPASARCSAHMAEGQSNSAIAAVARRQREHRREARHQHLHQARPPARRPQPPPGPRRAALARGLRRPASPQRLWLGHRQRPHRRRPRHGHVPGGRASSPTSESTETGDVRRRRRHGARVENENGSVEVTGADVDEITVGRRDQPGPARRPEHREAVSRTVAGARAASARRSRRGATVDYTVDRPDRPADHRPTSTTGASPLRDIDGAVTADGDNGGIELVRLGGELRVARRQRPGRGRRPALADRRRRHRQRPHVASRSPSAPDFVTATSDNGGVDVVVPDDGDRLPGRRPHRQRHHRRRHPHRSRPATARSPSTPTTAASPSGTRPASRPSPDPPAASVTLRVARPDTEQPMSLPTTLDDRRHRRRPRPAPPPGPSTPPRSTARATPPSGPSTTSPSTSPPAGSPPSWARRARASRRSCTASPASTTSRPGHVFVGDLELGLAVRRRPHPAAPRAPRLRVPVASTSSPRSPPRRTSSCRCGSPARKPDRAWVDAGDRHRRPARPARPPALGAVRRPAAARRRRPGAGQPARRRLRRRAHRQPRLPLGRRGARASCGSRSTASARPS